MAKAMIRLDNVQFTHDGSLIKSAKYMGSGDTATAIENANFVEIGGLMDGEREIHKATTPTAESTYFGVVCTPEVEYEERGYHGLDTFENKAGEPIRVGILSKGDIFSVTKEALDTVPTVGKLVELQAGTKGKVVDTPTDKSTQVGKVIEVEVSGRFTWYVIEVQ